MSKHKLEKKIKGAGSANTTLHERLERVERLLGTVVGEDQLNLRFCVESWRLTSEHALKQNAMIKRLQQELTIMGGYCTKNIEDYKEYLEGVKAEIEKQKAPVVVERNEKAVADDAFAKWKAKIDADPDRVRVVCLTCKRQWDVPSGEKATCDHCKEEGVIQDAKAWEMGQKDAPSPAPPTPAETEPAPPETEPSEPLTTAPEEPKALESPPDSMAKEP